MPRLLLPLNTRVQQECAGPAQISLRAAPPQSLLTGESSPKHRLDARPVSQAVLSSDMPIDTRSQTIDTGADSIRAGVTHTSWRREILAANPIDPHGPRSRGCGRRRRGDADVRKRQQAGTLRPKRGAFANRATHEGATRNGLRSRRCCPAAKARASPEPSRRDRRPHPRGGSGDSGRAVSCPRRGRW